MLPPGDEGAGEVWARPQSEDVRGHCERGRRGGGRGALPGALLWLEYQVRQNLGEKSPNVCNSPSKFLITLNLKGESPPTWASLTLHPSHPPSTAETFLSHNSASPDPVPWSRPIMASTGPPSGRNRIGLLGSMWIVPQLPLAPALLPNIPCPSVHPAAGWLSVSPKPEFKDRLKSIGPPPHARLLISAFPSSGDCRFFNTI